VGLLLDTRGGRLITLSARTLVGRSSVCLVTLDDPRASAEHAAIAWSGERWEVRDLGSLNGTWLDGRRLEAGARAVLTGDARLAFGGEGVWMLVDDRPVGPAARNDATDEVVHSTTGILALPHIDNPQATIFRRADGQWLVELGAVVRPVFDREPLELGAARWLLFLPIDLGQLPETLNAGGEALALRGIELRFAPSLDEEHVDVRVRTSGGKEWLLPARSSHYMLLTLARARVADAERGVTMDEQGWLYASDLADMLQYTAERLNVEIFRARSLFAKLGVQDFAHLVERRATSRQLRIGVATLWILRSGGDQSSSSIER
jgi:hypothetical protein